MLWIPATVAAAAFQVARNAAQRSLVGGAGPWGATLVRFLFGLPFTIAFQAAAWLFDGRNAPTHMDAAFFGFASTGALAQVMGTAFLLLAMRQAGFAVGTALQQSALPLAGVLGWLFFHDDLSTRAWIGVAVVTVGLAALTWPRSTDGAAPLTGVIYGLLSGLLIGFALNAFRHAGLTLAPGHPLYGATVTVTIAQGLQSLGLGAWLAVRDRAALTAVLKGWRESMIAGFCGACASTFWLFALALAPAASVRAVGVIESPLAAAAGRRLFAERISPGKLAAGALVTVGVVLTALG